jgi:predicted dehydrogenase
VNCLFVGAGAAADAYASELADDSSAETEADTPGLDLVGVCDLDESRAVTLAERHDATAYTDLDRMLAAEDAPLVIVLTSHAAHATVTRMALAADRHVFSQKPLALDAEEARDLVSMARSRDVALGCAPICPRHPAQRRAAGLLAEGRLGEVRLAYAHAHVGRVTEWHDNPSSFLAVGPLYDGAVYPLTLLVAWFGSAESVRVADSFTPWPDEASEQPKTGTHVEATISFLDGPRVRLTASLYAPHRSREFNSLELHGDDGSLYLADTGGGEDDPEVVQFGALGDEYEPVEPTEDRPDGRFLDGPLALAESIETGDPDRSTGRRAAHVVEICAAIEEAADAGGPVPVATGDGVSLREASRGEE